MIYYASHVLVIELLNYVITHKDFLVIAYAFDKFRSYVLGSKVIVYTNHDTLRYFLDKQESN